MHIPIIQMPCSKKQLKKKPFHTHPYHCVNESYIGSDETFEVLPTPYEEEPELLSTEFESTLEASLLEFGISKVPFDTFLVQS